MKTLLTLLFVATLGLTACSSSETKPDDVEVEERSTSAEASTSTDESADGSDVTTYGTDEYSAPGVDELNDPSSHLSVRIIYFAYDSSEIRPEFRPAIEAHASYLAANPDTIITLEGHTDERGSREYNLALGERRANAVKRQLTLLGASAGQIRTVSYGEERPEVEGHDESAWSQNRRVYILY